MNDILNEVLNEILLLGEESQASKEAKKKGLVYLGFKNYGPEKGGPATHKIDDTGKLVAINAKKAVVKPTKKPIQTPTAPSEPTKTQTTDKDAKSSTAGIKKQTAFATKPSKTIPSTGAKVFQEPIITPDGNKVLGIVDTTSATTRINAKIDKERATTDKLDPKTDAGIRKNNSRSLPESDESYYKRRGIKPKILNREIRNILKESNVPERYIQLLERSLNTPNVGGKPKFSNLTGGPVGKGSNTSQAGEIVALALMAVRNPKQRTTVANALINSSSLVSPAPILEKGWVTAGLAQADAFDAILRQSYVNENGSPLPVVVESIAWDVPEDIAGIGLDMKDKGFSTDGIIRVRVKGENFSRVVRLTLKKNNDVYLYNGSTSDAVDYALSTNTPPENLARLARIDYLLEASTDDNENTDEKIKAQDELKSMYSTNNIKVARRSANSDRGKIVQDAIDKLPKDISDDIMTIHTFAERQRQSARNLGILLGQLPEDFEEDLTEDDIKQIITQAEKFPDLKELLDAHFTLATEAGNSYIRTVIKNDVILDRLLLKLSQTFPLRTISEGEEVMCMGGIPLTSNTLEKMFGTKDVSTGLTIAQNDDVPPKDVLIYQAEGSTTKIEIAVVEPRQRGKGVAGTISLGFKPTRKFACMASCIEAENDPKNQSNSKIAQKCNCSQFKNMET